MVYKTRASIDARSFVRDIMPLHLAILQRSDVKSCENPKQKTGETTKWLSFAWGGEWLLGPELEAMLKLNDKEYTNVRWCLKLAIENSKHWKWENMRNGLNSNPWGLGCKTVTRKRDAAVTRAPQLEENMMGKIVDTLFPVHKIRSDPEKPVNEPLLLFTEDELRVSARSLKNNKAPRGRFGGSRVTRSLWAIYFRSLNIRGHCAMFCDSQHKNEWAKHRKYSVKFWHLYFICLSR